MACLLEQLKAGVSNYVERVFPGTDIKIRIRVLNNWDMLDSSMAADKIWKGAEIEVSLQNIKAYEAEKETQYLYRACSDLENKPLAPNVSEFRRLLTVSDRAWLIDQYNELDAESNPAPDTMPDDEFDALVESVKKNPNTLSKLGNISTLRRLALFLASPPVNSLTGSGPTSP